ncbi:MAG: RNA methyltransferase [Bacteroidetes bacterium]|nr:RNA methyltransferase [Bacteroidota bacterium]
MRKRLNSELGRLTPEGYRDAGKSPVVIVLDNIRSLMNTGSVFRSADAFRAEALYLCGITGTPPHREINKTALGSTGSVPWKYFESVLEAVTVLKKEGYIIISVEQAEGAISLEEFRFRKGKRYAIIFGHEINGVAQEVIDISDACIEIPQFGTKHSLNIAVAAGIVLWEAVVRSA